VEGSIGDEDADDRAEPEVQDQEYGDAAGSRREAHGACCGYGSTARAVPEEIDEWTRFSVAWKKVC